MSLLIYLVCAFCLFVFFSLFVLSLCKVAARPLPSPLFRFGDATFEFLVVGDAHTSRVVFLPRGKTNLVSKI